MYALLLSRWGCVDRKAFADYDLVRIHHPDSPVVRALGLTLDVAHARSQAISAAYDVLRDTKPSQDSSSESDARRTSQPPPAAASRGAHANRADVYIFGDDRWKDRITIGAVALVRPLLEKPYTIAE
jgi:hypothetical protein